MIATKRVRISGTLGLLLIFVFGSCGTRRPLGGQDATGVDHKLSASAFIEQGDIVTFIVGTHATSFRQNTQYIPLEISVANRGLRQLRLTRESFTLIDEDGNRYPAANPEELIRGYEFLNADRRNLAELRRIVFNRYAAFTEYPSGFSPTRGGSSLVRDTVSLPKFGYFFDFVYFPQPQSGLKGHRFELFMDSQDLENPVFVRFTVR